MREAGPPAVEQRDSCAARRHDTRLAYDVDGCRCAPAREDWRLYRKRLREGRWVCSKQPAAGTMRRLQGLARIGWPLEALAAELGWAKPTVSLLCSGVRYDLVHRATALRVAAVYDRLSMSPGPSARARQNAAKKGWQAPLAWDDDQIDDPAAVPLDCWAGEQQEWPGIDWVAVRLAAGGTPVRLTAGERIATIRMMAGLGRTDQDIAGALGEGRHKVMAARNKHGIAPGAENREHHEDWKTVARPHLRGRSRHAETGEVA